MIKKIGSGIILLVIIACIAGCSQLDKLTIISGYAAKKMCSCTFIAERSKGSIEKEDLGFSLLKLAKNKINRKEKSATSSVFGLAKKKAVYKENLGCVLLYGKDDYQIESPKFPNTTKVKPLVTGITKEVDQVKIQKAISNFMDPDKTMDSIKTRAIVVLHKDTIVAEAYADGIDKNTELLGWSMTKSVMNAWVGMMILDGKITLNDNNLFPNWTDERKDITLNDLLHMSSGLEWEENYAKVSGATTMLFNSEDAVRVASSPKLVYPPGKHWYYSSGTSNLISGYLKSKFTNIEDYHRFPYERIFHKLGMMNTTMESDEVGQYIGSSFCYGTARDWARFGLLYLHDGVWEGERLLPEGWVSYSTEEVFSSDGIYGAHFWLNKRGKAYPDLPHDMFSANGFQGQYVFVIPSKDLVIVRLGLNENLDFNQFLKEITSSLK